MAGHGLTTTDITSIQGNIPSLTNFLDTNSIPSSANAHLCYALFDDQMRYVSGDVDPVAVGGGFKPLDKFLSSPVIVNKCGYIYFFVTNKSNVDVFFDNLVVTQYKSPILEETHYHPFGLAMAGISSKAIGKMDNRIKFQGQELASKEFSDGRGLDIYEFKWCMHDPQMGRFWQIDPLAEKYFHNSTYAFSENKVTTHVELEGLEAENFMSKFKKPSELPLKPVPSGSGVQNQSFSVVVNNPKIDVSVLLSTFKDRPREILNNSKAEFNL